jgi:hypothetical protein
MQHAVRLLGMLSSKPDDQQIEQMLHYYYTPAECHDH